MGAFADEAAEEAQDTEEEYSGSESASVESETESAEEICEEMDAALEHVRDLGSVHQREFVDAICDVYADEQGAEPSTEILLGLFDGIKQLFAEEAEEEESELSLGRSGILTP